MPFFTHPANVEMTYFKHMFFSLTLSFKFAKASILAFIHSFYPDIFITSSTDTLENMSIFIKERVNHQTEVHTLGNE